MGFTSYFFLFVFLPITSIIWIFVSRCKSAVVQNIYLILISLFFYFWAGADSIIVFISIILAAYLFGHLIEAHRTEGTKYLAIAITLGVVFLLSSKYLFNTLTLIKANGTVWGKSLISLLIVPLGISFVTFEAISYYVDIYRGDAKAGSFLDAALFLTLYPKLISGPIVLWKDFSPQIRNHPVKAEEIHTGLRRIAMGYAKKVLLADSMGAMIASINSSMVTGIDTKTYWLRALLYMFQLYYDFSGYSDIAIGLLQLFGFTAKENFNYPYASLSVTEFWRRWHISLGSWFREYVYFPLGGSRKGNVYLNLFIVFLLTGIWHGSSWTYVLWGVLHGVIVIIERCAMKTAWYKKTPWPIKWFITMLFIGFTWVLFMSPDFPSAIATLRAMLFPHRNAGYNWSLAYFLTPKTILLLVTGGLLSVLGRFEKLNMAIRRFSSDTFAGVLLTDLLCLGLMALSIVFVVNSSYSPFLYFQF